MLAWLGEAVARTWFWYGVAGFVLLATWESFSPDREADGATAKRWCGNLFLYLACFAFSIALVPSLLTTDARSVFAVVGRVGGDAAILVLGLLTLDLFLYAIHRWQHAVFLFWRFHAVHHSDCRIDASTAMRHHPAEFVVVGAGSVAIFAVLGLPIWVFPIFNLLSLMEALFQHANMRLAARFERALEFLIVSPAMHRMHHSRNPDHYNHNYGNILSVWDRVFGTYGRLGTAERQAIAFGVPGQSEAQATSLLFSWTAPFRPRRAMGMGEIESFTAPQ